LLRVFLLFHPILSIEGRIPSAKLNKKVIIMAKSTSSSATTRVLVPIPDGTNFNALVAQVIQEVLGNRKGYHLSKSHTEVLAKVTAGEIKMLAGAFQIAAQDGLYEDEIEKVLEDFPKLVHHARKSASLAKMLANPENPKYKLGSDTIAEIKAMTQSDKDALQKDLHSQKQNIVQEVFGYLEDKFEVLLPVLKVVTLNVLKTVAPIVEQKILPAIEKQVVPQIQKATGITLPNALIDQGIKSAEVKINAELDKQTKNPIADPNLQKVVNVANAVADTVAKDVTNVVGQPLQPGQTAATVAKAIVGDVVHDASQVVVPQIPLPPVAQPQPTQAVTHTDVVGETHQPSDHA
jgi:hypothetical protein